MKKVELQLEDYLYEFYKKIGENAGGRTPEQVMSDALLRLAGGLSLKVSKEKKHKKQPGRNLPGCAYVCG